MTETTSDSPPFTTTEISGMPLAQLDRDGLLNLVSHSLAEGRGGWIVTANVDFLQRFRSQPEIRELYEGADIIVADGIPLVWAASLRGTPVPERIAGSDLVWSLTERAGQEARSVYLLGGNEGVAAAAAQQFTERWPELKIAGHSSPWISVPPTDEERAQLVTEVAESKPDIVYVALGSPKQEFVIQELRRVLPGAWFMGVGISFSFVAGEIRRAPRWMQKLGLEWIHRLIQEPRRLAKRYLLGNLPFAVGLLFRESLRGLSRGSRS